MNPTHNPFANYAIDAFDSLHAAERVNCPSCGKRKRWWCAECSRLLLPPGSQAPQRVKLPLRFEVLQALRESPQTSTAGQAATLAPAHVRVWRDEKRFESEVLVADCSTIALLYPREGSCTLDEVPHVKTLIVIDAPWTKARLMAEGGPLRSLRCVRLDLHGRRSSFWRYAPLRGQASAFNADAVKQALSTVEAIHQACVEKKGDADCKQLDNLLWLFAFQHSTVSRALKDDPVRMSRVMQKSKGVLADRFG